MKKITLSILTFFSFGLIPAAQAATSDMMVAATMQRCTTNEECALVSNSCNDNCGFVPVNKANLPTLDGLYQSRCGKPMSANPACTVNPPVNAACVNARCSIDYAYAHNASAGDYKAGAYPVPEAAVPSKVQGDYSHVNDRNGQFTAYDLPDTKVKQNTVGTITTKVYVPPSAPVSGGNYVPVGPATTPVAVTAPVAPVVAPSVPPAAVPTMQTHATPPELIPPVVPKGSAPYLPPVAATPTVPTMTPSIEPSTYVPAPPAIPETAPIPSVGATGIPQAPVGAKPIPPSDLQPVPTFIPPPGTASPVAAEDPGAPPPADTTLIMTTAPDGSEGMTMGPSTKAKAKEAAKSFAGQKPAQSGTFN